jgi:hypothetical protein
MLISSEHLVSRLSDPRKFPAMKKWLERVGEVEHIVVYLRRQDELFTSLYSTHIKSGSTKRFVWTSPPVKNASFNHRAMLERWIETFPSARFSVQAYEPHRFENGNLVDDFLHLLDLPGERPPEPSSKNLSLDPEGLAVLRGFNVLTGRFVGRREAGRARALVIKALSEGDSGERVSLSEDEATQMLAAFEEVNQWLSEQFTPGHPFFDTHVESGQEHRGLPRVSGFRVVRRLLRGFSRPYVR